MLHLLMCECELVLGGVWGLDAPAHDIVTLRRLFLVGKRPRLPLGRPTGPTTDKRGDSHFPFWDLGLTISAHQLKFRP